MEITQIIQPRIRLGDEISIILNTHPDLSRIVIVSAFTGLRTILRLRDKFLELLTAGTSLELILGIDMRGTSRQVLEEVLNWNCNTRIFHNPLPRATFHPKIYIFQSCSNAVIFIGSNNLTDGGLYTNYEAATKYCFELPSDQSNYDNIIHSLSFFIHPDENNSLQLTRGLIDTLVARGVIPNEAEARNTNTIRRQPSSSDVDIPENPFVIRCVENPPLLPRELRHSNTLNVSINDLEPTEQSEDSSVVEPIPTGLLVWQKQLPRSDALQVNEGTNNVGGVRLTQARFQTSDGNNIDQTTYFRQLFDEYQWEPEQRGRVDQEHTFVPMRVIIRDNDYGVRNFEISHKPSGEAGQANYTTILRWGRDFAPTIREENITDLTLSLYEVVSQNYRYMLRIE